MGLGLPVLPNKVYFVHICKFTTFCRDCLYPANIGGTRIRICVQAFSEWLDDEYYNKPIADKFEEDRPPLLIFYECMIALNVETLDDAFEDKEIRRSGKSFSRDYKMLAVEICFLGNCRLKHMGRMTKVMTRGMVYKILSGTHRSVRKYF